MSNFKEALASLWLGIHSNVVSTVRVDALKRRALVEAKHDSSKTLNIRRLFNLLCVLLLT